MTMLQHTSFGQNPEVFNLPSSVYPRAPRLFISFCFEGFFPVPEYQRSAEEAHFAGEEVMKNACEGI